MGHGGKDPRIIYCELGGNEWSDSHSCRYNPSENVPIRKFGVSQSQSERDG